MWIDSLVGRRSPETMDRRALEVGKEAGKETLSY